MVRPNFIDSVNASGIFNRVEKIFYPPINSTYFEIKKSFNSVTTINTVSNGLTSKITRMAAKNTCLKTDMVGYFKFNFNN